MQKGLLMELQTIMGFQLDEKEYRIAKEIFHYRRLGVRWCVLEKRHNMDRKELKRLECLYKFYFKNMEKK